MSDSLRAKLELLAAKRVLALLPSEEMAGVAVALIEAGADSEAFANLAGATPQDHPVDLRALFDAGLAECDVSIPNRLEAATRLKLHFASQVASGEISPAVGTARIVDLFQAIEFELPRPTRYVGDQFGIARLYGLWDERGGLRHDDDRRRQSIESEILDECRTMIGSRD